MDVAPDVPNTARWHDVVESFPDLTTTYAAMDRNLDSMRENTKAYYRWIADTLKPALGRRTMELGAGPGFLTNYMRDFEYYLITETWEPYLAELRKLKTGRNEVEVQAFDASDLISKRDHFKALKFDSIFSTNMLEHIKDDIQVMRDMGGVVRPGGRVVNFVPAYRYLYGEADRVIGHYRRYEPDELRAKMEAAGLIVDDVRTFNQAGFFSWLIVKMLRRDAATGDNYALFDRMVPLFRAWERFIPLPLGLSLIGIGRTPS